MPDNQRRLVEALRLPFVETHISYVLFDRGYAYKIKKAVRFPFLDFTTLAAREFFCREELRLNRRLAPSIYLDVVPIAGTPDAPVVDPADGHPSSPALEYAVKIREFDQDQLFDALAKTGRLDRHVMDQLADRIAEFHASAEQHFDDGGAAEMADLAEVQYHCLATQSRAGLRRDR